MCNVCTLRTVNFHNDFCLQHFTSLHGAIVIQHVPQQTGLSVSTTFIWFSPVCYGTCCIFSTRVIFRNCSSQTIFRHQILRNKSPRNSAQCIESMPLRIYKEGWNRFPGFPYSCRLIKSSWCRYEMQTKSRGKKPTNQKVIKSSKKLTI